jgi:uncharacterized OB-fold protein
MKKQAQEYAGKCSKCGTVYISEDRYTVCPVCGKPLTVEEVLLKPLGESVGGGTPYINSSTITI